MQFICKRQLSLPSIYEGNETKNDEILLLCHLLCYIYNLVPLSTFFFPFFSTLGMTLLWLCRGSLTDSHSVPKQCDSSMEKIPALTISASSNDSMSPASCNPSSAHCWCLSLPSRGISHPGLTHMG